MMNPTENNKFTTGGKADFYKALAILENGGNEDWNPDTSPAYWNEMPVEDLWMELIENYETADWELVSMVEFRVAIEAEGYKIENLSKVLMDGKRVSIPMPTILLK